jgi:hypothetical protein
MIERCRARGRLWEACIGRSVEESMAMFLSRLLHDQVCVKLAIASGPLGARQREGTADALQMLPKHKLACRPASARVSLSTDVWEWLAEVG